MTEAAEHKKKEKKRKRLFILVLWGLFLLPFLFIGIMLLRAANSDLPSFKQLEDPQTDLATQIYSADGEVLGKYFRENRTRVDYKELSPHLVNALIATEDIRYRQHSGIDLKALARAASGVLTGGSRGGGSTITQQLAKLLFHKPTGGIWTRVDQKFKEWIIAVRLERQYTKEEIIAMYLNKFDFLNNAVGIESASQVYFNRAPDSLELHEAAMLVGMAKNPSLFNPLKRPDTTRHRREIVLYQMKRYDYITEEEYDSIRQMELGLRYQRVDHRRGLAPYFREELRRVLGNMFDKKNEKGEYKYAKEDGTPYDIYSDGLKVYTTLDASMQRHAEQAVKRHIGGELQEQFWDKIQENQNPPFSDEVSKEKVEGVLRRAKKRSTFYKTLRTKGITKDSIDRIFNTPKEMEVFSWDGPIDTTMTPMDSIRYYKSFLRTGMVSIEPQTGFIRTWVGGVNHEHFQYDHVAQGRRQVGSTFKPFVYATAIREGYSPCYKVPNEKHCIEIPDQPDWCPENSDKKYGKEYSLRSGLANSKNTITAWVMKQFGPEAVIKLTRDLGVQSPIEEVPSIALGATDLSLMEMTSAHAAMVNKGVHIKPVMITRIEDKEGNSIYEMKPKSKEALDQQTAYVMIDIMKGVVDGVYDPLEDGKRGTGMRLRYDRPYGGFDNPIAGKTGTTQDNSDGWFIGSVPELVTGIWVGAEDRSVRWGKYNTSLGQGANTSLPIWGYFMNDVYEDEEIELSKDDFEEPEELDIILDCEEYEEDEGGNEDPDWGS